MNKLNADDRKTLDNYTGMSVGSLFRRTREGKGYDLQQIAQHLNIGSDHLEAIEKDDYDALPQKVYAVGFVRAYADLLELDAEKMSYLFKVQAYGKKQTESQKAMVKTDGKSVGLRDAILSNSGIIPLILVMVIAAGLVIATIVFLFMWIFSERDDDRFIVPEVPVEMLEGGVNTQQDFIESEPQADAIAPTEPMSLIVKPDEGAQAYGVKPLDAALTFKIMAPTSLEIRLVETGDALVTQAMNKGDVVYISETQDILLSTDNVGAIEVYLDNQKLGTMGEANDPVRLRPFSVRALRLQRGG